MGTRQNFNGPHDWRTEMTPRRMLKKTDQQGRSENAAGGLFNTLLSE